VDYCLVEDGDGDEPGLLSLLSLNFSVRLGRSRLVRFELVVGVGTEGGGWELLGGTGDTHWGLVG
jgi:hypothetical protein